MAKQGFYTDGMTVEQILSLGPDVLSKLSERDMSRALRTVSLAANKRIDRLLDNAILRHGQYIEKKSARHAISTDALNKIYDESGHSSKAMRFSVGDKTRDQMYHELMRAKDFMKLKTSTITGAVGVRKTREARLFGTTREDVKREAAKEYKRAYKKQTGKKPTKQQVEKVQKSAFLSFQQQSSDIWSRFRRIWEIPNIRASYGSDEVIDYVAHRTVDGASEEKIISELVGRAMESYEAEQDAANTEAEQFYEDNDGIDFYDEEW